MDPSKVFLQVLIKAGQRISIHIAGKSGLKLGNLPSLRRKGDALKASEDIVPQSREILPRFVLLGAKTCTPPYKRR